MLGHVQGRHLEEIITAVLKHHAVAPGPFAGIHQLPAFIYGHGSRNLDGGMVAMFKGIDSDRSMVEPVRGDIYKVDILPVTQFLVGFLAKIVVSGRHASPLEYILTDVQTVLFQVAESHYLDPIDLGIPLDGAGAPASDTHECDADGVDRIALHSEGTDLAGSP